MEYPKNVLSHSLQILSDNKIKYALIGGFAVGIHSTVRTTKDIDLSILVENDQQAEDIIKLFILGGFKLSQLFEKKSLNRIAGVRLISPYTKLSDPDLDLLFLFSGIEYEIIEEANDYQLLGNTIKVISLPHLIALKCLSANENRLQDEIDLKGLLGSADLNIQQDVLKNLELIMNRGFNDGMDLVLKYQNFLSKLTKANKSSL